MSEEDSISDIPTEDTEESKPTETSQLLTVFSKTIHHEDDSSEDKPIIEIELPKENRGGKQWKRGQILTTNYQVEMEN